MKKLFLILLSLCSIAQAETLDIQSAFRKQSFETITNNTQVLTDINADELRNMITNAIAIAANTAYTNAAARTQAASNALALAVASANTSRASGDDGLQAVIGAVSNLFHAVAQAEAVTRSNAVAQALAGVTGNSNRIETVKLEANSFAQTNKVTTLHGTSNEWLTVSGGTSILWRVTIDGQAFFHLQGSGNPSWAGNSPSGTNLFIRKTGLNTTAYIGNGYWFRYSDGLYADNIDIAYGVEPPLEIVWTAPSIILPTSLSTATFPEDAVGSWMISYAPGPVTNASPMLSFSQLESAKEYHRDSYTNIIWQSVYSNGWTWLIAHTNYPAL
jgi:hypothetical protein